jgi:rod shape-determining protein MreC
VTFDERKKSKPLFVLRGPLGLRLALLVTLSIGLMSADARHHHLDQVRRVLSAIVYPVRLAVDAPVTVASWLGENLRDQRTLLRQNADLRGRQREYDVALQRLAALEAENARLRALMDSAERVDDRVLHGEIMAVDLDDRFRHRVVIDKGRRAGAFDGQALISAEGIVGQIMRADDLSSEAILISDPGHAIPVAVNRTGLLTIAYGTGDTDRLDLPFLPRTVDIREGDLLVSSGLGQKFPQGYPVAVVTSVTYERDRPFAVVQAQPTALLNQTRQLLLVWSDETRRAPPQFVNGNGRDTGEREVNGLTASTFAQ